MRFPAWAAGMSSRGDHMRRRIGFLLVLLFWPVAILAREHEVTAVLYRAVQVVRGTGSETILVPEPFRGYDAARLDDSILRAFDALKGARPAEYGRATLLLDSGPGGVRHATLNLDPTVPGSHALVAAEVFHTLRGLGVSVVRVPALRQAPLDTSALRYPVFLLAVPFHEALPPRRYSHAIILLSPLEAMSSDLFYQKLDRGDPDVMERVLGGLVRGDDRVKLAVLAAVPSLNVAHKAQRLLPLLDDPSPAVRLAVLKLLEHETGEDVTRRLSQVVETDTDSAVKVAAARILSERGIKRYDIFIEIDRLSDPAEDVVLAAVTRIVETRNPIAAEGLYQCLTHPSAQVRAHARKGLVQIGATTVMARAVQDDRLDRDTREAFALELAGSQDPSGRRLAWVYLVESGTESGANKAVTRIAETRPDDGLPILYRALLRPEATLRAAAVEAIVLYRNPVSLAPLLGSPRTESERVAVEAAAIRILSSQTTEALLSFMEGSDPTIRRLAMKAFGDSLRDAPPPTRAVAVLQARLEDSDPAVRRAAVYALARVPDERVTTAILGLSRDPDPEIRAAAAVAAARSQDPAAPEILVRALNDEWDAVVMAGIQGIAARRHQPARESLRILCSHGNPDIRRGAVRAYLDLLDPGEAARDLDFLTSLLYVPDPAVKIAGIEVVRQIHERRAIVALSALVIDPNRDVKVAAIQALASTKAKDALEGIEKAVFDSDPSVRVLALDALVTLGHREAVDFLNEVIRLESDPEIRARAEKAREALLSR